MLSIILALCVIYLLLSYSIGPNIKRIANALEKIAEKKEENEN